MTAKIMLFTMTMLSVGLAVRAQMPPPPGVIFGAGPGPRMFGGPLMGMGMGPEGFDFAMLLGGIDLSAEQEAKVQSILVSRRPTFEKLFNDVRTKQDALTAELLSPKPVKGEDLTGLVQEISRLREQLMREGLAATLEIRGVLTPQQLAKAAEVRKRLNALQGEMRALLGEPPHAIDPMDK